MRLEGPKPEWVRADGGEGGTHPSNVHDHVYALGAVNFTGGWGALHFQSRCCWFFQLACRFRSDLVGLLHPAWLGSDCAVLLSSKQPFGIWQKGRKQLQPAMCPCLVHPTKQLTHQPAAGDHPVVLTVDGPSLGGFVCPVTITSTEVWKIGQVRPGELALLVKL